MSVFYTILQKHLDVPQIIVPTTKTEYEFCETSYKNNVNNNFVICFFYQYLYRLYYCANNQTKLFVFNQYYLENMFLSHDMKEEMLSLFSKSQKTYHALSKFAYIWKFKRAKIQIHYDMCMNDLDEKHKHTFILLQNNFKYFFSIYDLIKIIKTGLTNSSYFFPSPVLAKNPYNNVYFNTSTLYNIYFFMKDCGYVIPTLFHQYFIAGWNLDYFLTENECFIRNALINDYITYSHYETLHPDVISMLKDNKYGKLLPIHKDFPKETLVSIMKPYLRLYMNISSNIHGTIKRNECLNLFYIKMKIFYLYNRHFGRKKVTSKTSTNYVFEIDKETTKTKFYKTVKTISETEYNMKHVDFKQEYTNQELDIFYNSIPYSERTNLENNYYTYFENNVLDDDGGDFSDAEN
jgi:hypothetical protein